MGCQKQDQHGMLQGGDVEQLDKKANGEGRGGEML